MAQSVAPLPVIYKAFFLYIEPFATAVGAYYAWFQQDEYMRLTYPAFSVSPWSSPWCHGRKCSASLHDSRGTESS